MKLPYSIFGYEELHDLIADPSESYSVAASHPEVAAEMRSRLEAAQTEFAPYRQKEIPASLPLAQVERFCTRRTECATSPVDAGRA